jgi:hypothetical protein
VIKLQLYLSAIIGVEINYLILSENRIILKQSLKAGLKRLAGFILKERSICRRGSLRYGTMRIFV